VRGLGIILKREGDCITRDTKRLANLLMGPASVVIERICNITLTEGEPGSWISKNWIAKKWRWMVTTVLAYKIWHFIVGCIQSSVPSYFN